MGRGRRGDGDAAPREYQARPEATASEFLLRPFAVDEADPMDLANRQFPSSGE